uniref:Protein MADS AFFECTING FLOWERING 5 n=1 Tax=Noccaea caerulescens TaxID=107243 RepID=A0A1J3H8Y8_NOCCA
MGRRKVEIKRIENKSSRQVTFCKRRNGLMEKARQLSVLCESSVATIIVFSTGKLYSSSSGESMAKIIERYEMQHTDELKTLDLAEKTENHLSHKELLETIQCKTEEAKRDDISVESLISLEEQFKTALSVTRARKTELMMELVKSHEEKEKVLREQNQVLADQLTKMVKKRLLEREDERVVSLENYAGNNPPETLPLLK